MPGLLYEADLPVHGSLEERQQLQYDNSCISERYHDYSDNSSPTSRKEHLLSTNSAKNDEEEESQEAVDGGNIFNSSIKLGLGDFCFYSMLV